MIISLARAIAEFPEAMVAWDAGPALQVADEIIVFRRRMATDPEAEDQPFVVASLWACCKSCDSRTEIQIQRPVNVARCRCMVWHDGQWISVRSDAERRLWIEAELERLATIELNEDDIRDAIIKEAVLLDPRVTYVSVYQMRRRDLGLTIVATRGSDLEDVEERARRVFARVVRGSGPAPLFYLGHMQVGSS